MAHLAHLALALVACFHATASGSGSWRAPPVFAARIPYASFLGDADVTWSWDLSSPQLRSSWNSVPSIYWQGGFIGNGNLGAICTVQAPLSAGAARGGGGPSVGAPVLTLGRTDVFERRAPPSPLSTGDIFCDEGRLPIGNLTLRTVGDVVSGEMRLVLHRAEIVGSLNTTQGGHVRFRVLVLAGQSDSLMIEMNTSVTEARARWEFHPLSANASRPVPSFGLSENFPCRSKRYTSNPPVVAHPPRSGHSGSAVRVWMQPLLVGLSYSTTFAENVSDGGRSQVVAVSTTAPSSASDDGERGARAADDAAVAATTRLLRAAPRAAALALHRAAWQEYYARSFLSIAQPRLEQFYWARTWAHDFGCAEKTAPLSRGGFQRPNQTTLYI